MDIQQKGNEFFLTQDAKATLVGIIKGTEASITSLVVWKDDDKRKGIGTQLVKEFLKLCAARGCSSCKVVSSPEAISFYKRLGFKGSGCVLYYKRAETAWTYANPRVKIKTPVLKGPKLTAVAESLEALVMWLRRPNRDAGQSLKLKQIKVLVEAFGYDPFIGEVYRGLRYKENAKVVVGSKLRLPVGIYKLTSWSTNQRGAREFGKRLKSGGNSVAVVRLVSDELQVASIVWAQAIANYLVTTELGAQAESIGRSQKLLERFLDNDEEVIMYITGVARVEVLEIL